MGQRLRKALEMPHLSRSKRNQRVAIAAAVVILGVYLLVWPTVSGMIGGNRPASTSPSAPAAPPHSLGRKK